MLPRRADQACSTCWPTRTRTSTLRAPGSKATPSSSTTRRWLSCTRSTRRYVHSAIQNRHGRRRSRPVYLFGITHLVLDSIANSQFLCLSGRFTRWTRWCRTRRTSGTRSRVCTKYPAIDDRAWREGSVNRSFTSSAYCTSITATAALGRKKSMRCPYHFAILACSPEIAGALEAM